ncbi:nucleotidyltransferase family protein [Flaviflexus massiliensis]|uniref:nucleotidyltransferase family protein n=1 Tax=Flaviflexus massiliensis TaxID=1522309 RepID=UPI0006D53218|nr:nucleotidyltransferase domain-containing protein [Flaviflexus massiliensis]
MTISAGVNLGAIRRAALRHGVAELALFGSVVTGDLGEDSDIDFLVDFLPDRPDPFEDFCALRDDLRTIVNRDVDLVVKRAIRNPYFRESALRQAKVVYVADI